MSNVHDAQILISICTYNEKENIQRLLPMIREALPAAHIMVVDDNSPDGTANVVRELSQFDQHIELFLRLNKEGLGAAQLASFRKACESSFDFLINMDADFSHHPRYLPSLIAAMETADVVIGSRYVPGRSPGLALDSPADELSGESLFADTAGYSGSRHQWCLPLLPVGDIAASAPRSSPFQRLRLPRGDPLPSGSRRCPCGRSPHSL